ncbi:uncharacterized protein LOC120346302 [Styela clava]
MSVIDFRQFPNSVQFNQSGKDGNLSAQRPFVYPFAKENNNLLATFQLKPPVSNYNDQFIHKIVSKTLMRPTSPTRRHNPQSHKAIHLARICYRPVCDVTSRQIQNRSNNVINSKMSEDKTPLSTCQSAYKIDFTLSNLSRQGVKHPWTKRSPAKGILPIPSRTGCGGPSERTIILPSCQKEDVNFMTSLAWKMNPRRRRFPVITTHNWGYNIGSEPMTTTTRSTFTRKPLPIKLKIEKPRNVHNIINGETLIERRNPMLSKSITVY